jgi:acyl-CoA reductase-like NAD-dependent aldehyde dehydrogenase
MMKLGSLMVVSSLPSLVLLFGMLADWLIGMKASGYGRFGASGLEEWIRTKTVTFRD